MLYFGNLTVFDHKTSEWSIFKSKLVNFMQINNVKKENEAGILLTHITDETYRLVRNLAYPSQLESLSYTELVKLLDGHFKPKTSSFVDRAKLYGATRNPGESLGDWAARLRGLASSCDFGVAFESNVTDRFVLGLDSGPERDKLFEFTPATLSLTRSIEVAEQAAYTKEAKTTLCTKEAGHVKEEEVFRARF